MDRLQTAQGVADALFDAERAMDDALAKAAVAVAKATQARAALGAGMKVGAGAITKMAAGAHTLAGVRETFAEAHQELDVAQRLLGLRTNMTGGGEKGPNQNGVENVSPLRAA